MPVFSFFVFVFLANVGIKRALLHELWLLLSAFPSFQVSKKVYVCFTTIALSANHSATSHALRHVQVPAEPQNEEVGDLSDLDQCHVCNPRKDIRVFHKPLTSTVQITAHDNQVVGKNTSESTTTWTFKQMNPCCHQTERQIFQRKSCSLSSPDLISDIHCWGFDCQHKLH